MLLPWQPVTFQKKFPMKREVLNVAMERYCFRKLIIKASNNSITFHGNKIFDFRQNNDIIGCRGNSATTPFFLISVFLILNKMIKVT